MKAEVGIITFHCVENLGGVLQAFALEKTINSTGKKAEFINYQPKNLVEPYNYKVNFNWLFSNYTFPNAVKKVLFRIINRKKLMNRKAEFDYFRKEFMHISPTKYRNLKEIYANLPKYSYYVSGSDQVWNPSFLEKTESAYLLNFVPKSSKKISYAASMGVDPNEKYNYLYESHVKEFSSISVREANMVPYFSNFTKENIKLVLDPTLLLSKEDWETVSVKNEIDEKFLLVYDLEFNDEIIKLVNRVAKELDLKVISYSDSKSYTNRLETFKFQGPSQFINLISQADFVISSSFHGTVFSIIFNKPFYTIPHSTKGSRMISLLRKLNLESRIWKEEQYDEIDYHVNYEEPNELLARHKNESLDFILNSLK